jgi:sigma-B regulation protein RsbU (phosphoserine phosphatase)
VSLLSTDGVTEAENRAHKLYSFERLTKALATARVSDARRVVTAVIEDVSRFIGGAAQADDMTLLAIRRRVAGTAS